MGPLAAPAGTARTSPAVIAARPPRTPHRMPVIASDRNIDFLLAVRRYSHHDRDRNSFGREPRADYERGEGDTHAWRSRGRGGRHGACLCDRRRLAVWGPR